MLKQLSPKDSG